MARPETGLSDYEWRRRARSVYADILRQAALEKKYSKKGKRR